MTKMLLGADHLSFDVGGRGGGYGCVVDLAWMVSVGRLVVGSGLHLHLVRIVEISIELRKSVLKFEFNFCSLLSYLLLIAI